MLKNKFEGGYIGIIIFLIIAGLITFLFVKHPEIFSNLLSKISSTEQVNTETSEPKIKDGVTEGNYFQKAFHAVDDAKEVTSQLEDKYKVHEQLLNE